MVMVLPVIDEIEIQHIKAWGDTPRTPAKMKSFTFCSWLFVYLTSNFDSMYPDGRWPMIKVQEPLAKPLSKLRVEKKGD